MPRGRPRKNPLTHPEQTGGSAYTNASDAPSTEPTRAQVAEIQETLEQLPEVEADPTKYPCTIAEDVAISILLRGSGHPEYLAGLHASLSDGALRKLEVLLDRQEAKEAADKINTHIPLPNPDLGPWSLR